jgi:hypothetical protein
LPCQLLCADIDGFSLHATVPTEAHDRKRLERLCRYITRPALSDDRVQLNAAGQVVFRLKTAGRDGTTTHLVMSPPEFVQRLAALVPRTRLPAGNANFTPLNDRFALGNRAICNSAWGRSATFDDPTSRVQT